MNQENDIYQEIENDILEIKEEMKIIEQRMNEISNGIKSVGIDLDVLNIRLRESINPIYRVLLNTRRGEGE